MWSLKSRQMCIFLDQGRLQVTKTVESKAVDEGDYYTSLHPHSPTSKGPLTSHWVTAMAFWPGFCQFCSFTSTYPHPSTSDLPSAIALSPAMSNTLYL